MKIFKFNFTFYIINTLCNENLPSKSKKLYDAEIIVQVARKKCSDYLLRTKRLNFYYQKIYVFLSKILFDTGPNI